MSGLESLLATRAGFVLAALAASWIAVALLALIVANLHFRLVRLERAQPAAEEGRTPFGHLLGRPLVELLGDGAAPGARLVLVLSAGCPSCERVLDELRRAAEPPVTVLLWRDEVPSPLPALPAGAAVPADGRRISAALGVRVSPFALAADADGRVVEAAPVGRLAAFAEVLRRAGGSPSAAAREVAPVSSPLSHPPFERISP